MPSKPKAQPKAGASAPKKTKAAKASTSKPPAPPSSEEEENLASEAESGSDSEDEGVDEEGMARLMKALGEDGLDEFARASLEALEEEEEDSEEEAEEDEGEEEDGIEEGVEEEDGSSEGEAEEEDAEEVEVEDAQESDADEVALDEAESVDEDVVAHQKVEIDNKIAMERIRDTIKLDPSMPWTETLTVTYPETITVDVDDDLNRELAFYKQALHCAQEAKNLAAKHSFPFTRPSDYFAEMVKSDAHMERIRQRLLDEGATIKRSEEKRKEREGKKFGKQVQLEKLKERERSKKDMEERLKGLKRKRKGALDNAQGDDDAFDVAVEDAIADRPAKRGRGGDKRGMSRQARDGKFGFGGPGRRAKQNTKSSTDDFEPRRGGGGKPVRGGPGGARRGGRGGASRGGASRGGGSRRPGKSRREAARSRA